MIKTYAHGFPITGKNKEHETLKENFKFEQISEAVFFDGLWDLEKEIMVDFCEAQCGDRSKLLNYFIKNKLKELTESIGEF